MPSMAAVCPLLKRQEDRASMIWRLSVEASGAAVTREAVPEAGVPGEAVAGKASLAFSISSMPYFHHL